jgi:hypothetical protein
VSAVRRTGPPCRYDESSLVIWLDRDFLPECKVDSDLLSAHVKYTPRTSFLVIIIVIINAIKSNKK